MKGLFRKRFSLLETVGMIAGSLLLAIFVSFAHSSDFVRGLPNQAGNIDYGGITGMLKTWYTFNSGDVISSSQVNANFKYLKDLVEKFVQTDTSGSVNGHISTLGSKTPTFSACSPTSTLNGTDMAGVISINSMTSICQIYFAEEYKNPICTASNSTGGSMNAPLMVSIDRPDPDNKQALTLKPAFGVLQKGDKLSYICVEGGSQKSVVDQ